MSRINYPMLAQRVFNRPLAILPDKAEIIMGALAARMPIASLTRNGRPVQLAGWDDDDWGEPEPATPYDNVHGVAVIEARGTLVHRTGSLRPYSGMTGYDGLRTSFAMAFNDDAVRGICFDVDSPGGEVSGLADLADDLYQARGKKPVWAILSESAFSAAYWLASACDKIIVPRTGGTGSIGVIMMHVDMSKALEQAGVAVTLITYGARKGEGNPYEALPPDVRDRLQAEIARTGELFVTTVARNRGLSADLVRGTEAGLFFGAQGVELGLADAEMAPTEAFQALLAEIA